MFIGRKPVIPFLTAGFPSQLGFLDAACALCEAGAGAIEIGMPFSDPLADGTAIQHSSKVALARGTTIRKVLELTCRLRARINVPIFLMGYINPIMSMGLTRFAAAAYAAGADGTIIPDCPPEEAKDWIAASRRHRLSNIFLIAPTSPEARIKRIDRLSTDFSYCVAVAGVTGARDTMSKDTISYLRRVRRLTNKPFVVGFGIAQPDHIRALRRFADGFVVGSALVPLLDGGRSGLRSAAQLITGMVRAAE